MLHASEWLRFGSCLSRRTRHDDHIVSFEPGESDCVCYISCGAGRKWSSESDRTAFQHLAGPPAHWHHQAKQTRHVTLLHTDEETADRWCVYQPTTYSTTINSANRVVVILEIPLISLVSQGDLFFSLPLQIFPLTINWMIIPS